MNTKKMGRPKKDPDEKMSKSVQIYMTEQEYIDILKSIGGGGSGSASKKSGGKSISELLKELLLSKLS